MDEMELDLHEILYILRRRLWLLLALPLVAAVTAWAVSAFLTAPTYQASTTLWVIQEGGAGQISYNDLLLNRNLTKTYAEIARSRTVLQQAIERLGLDLTVNELADRLTTAAVRDTELISLTVKDRDPVRAAEIANAVAAAFQEQIRVYMKVENVAVVDRATPAADPVSPRVLMNTAVALVLGGMLAVGLAFLLEYLDTSIRTPEDVQRHLGLPVLATIPQFEPSPEPARAYRPQRVHSAAEVKR